MASVNPGPGRESRIKTGSAPLLKMGAQSSWIASFEYDAPNLTLTTILKSGAIYQHKDVSPGEWTQLQTAQSHSSFWTKAIKGKKISVSVKSAKAPNSEIKLG